MDTRRAKLFIKVDGVIGDRKRICTFCNNTVEGVEKIVDTTRKLRHGPYFPQLAYLQSAVGKIDTLGRAAVCLPCFHQLLRQWSVYEQKNVPVQRRTYRCVSDPGVKNYEETRAFEIRTEAEKRAFAIYTKQDHIVKKSFANLTRLLDAEEDLIRGCEERIFELNRQLTCCIEGEHSKINREIEKQKRTIEAAELRIEEEEDREEEIRKEAKALLDVYRNNQSLFRAVSEPNLFHFNEHQSLEIPEENFHRIFESKDEELQPNSEFVDTVDSWPVTTEEMSEKFVPSHEYQEPSHQGYGRGSMTELIDGEEDVCDFGSTGTVGNHRSDMTSTDVWDQLKTTKGYIKENHEGSYPTSEWHLEKEIIYTSEPKSQSLRKDEWSKLLIQEHEGKMTESQRESNNWINRSEQRSEQNYKNAVNFIKDDVSLRNESLMNEAVNIAAQRKNRIWKETDTDESDESEGEKVYEVNPSEWSTHKSSGIEQFHQNEMPRIDYVYGKIENNGGVAESTETWRISNDLSTDPWDNILIEREKAKRKVQNFSPGPAEDDNYTSEDHQDMVGRTEKEVLSPGRLDSTRFSEFTKSSYVPQPAQRQISIERSPGYVKYSAEETDDVERNKREINVTVMEKKNKSIPEQHTARFQIKNDWDEPVKQNRNSYERHLSVEEEEWERKHLNPNRLDESKWINFLNENSKDNVERVRTNGKFTMHQNNNGYIYDNSIRSNERLDSRYVSDSKKEAQIHVEHSPALRQLMKQDKATSVVDEQGIEKMVAKVSLKSDPSDNLGNKTINNHSNIKNEPALSDSNGKVGRIDLRQWSSKVEKNRKNESSSDEESNVPRIKNTRFDDYHERNLSDVDQDYNEGVSFREQTTGSSRMKNYSETVIIEEQETIPNYDVKDITKKPIGKLNLSLWEQNGTRQSDINGLKSTAKISPIDETKSMPFSLRNKLASEIPNNIKSSPTFENDGRFVDHSISNQNSTILARSQKSGSSNYVQPNSSENVSHSINRSWFLNQSMSKEELAWEKRYSKSYETNSFEESDEEQGTQNKASEPTTPRLVDDDVNENENQLNLGKIVLDEDEMRRVREGGNQRYIRNQETKIPSSTSIDCKMMHRQIPYGFSSPKQIERAKYGDISQLSEEEKAWEEKTSRPGKLDFSKFTHFT